MRPALATAMVHGATLKFGAQEVAGVIVEDRGNLGVGGRRLIDISDTDTSEPIEVEIPAEDVKAKAA